MRDPMSAIRNEHIEQAERALSSRAAATTTPAQLNAAIAERFGFTPEQVANFVDKLYHAARDKHFPGVDPRLEQNIVVLMRHCLLVGAGAAKISEGKG